MLKNSLICLILMVAVSCLSVGQVLLPAEVNDSASRNLQQHYFEVLKTIGEQIRGYHYRYPFSLSTVLDIDQKIQPQVDQRSIRFGRYGNRRLLIMTGNYFVSYSASAMDRNHRARQTFNDVILPMLKAAVPPLANAEGFQGYAIEVSHHVRAKVLGVISENPENVVLIISRETAEKLVAGKNADEQQAALLEAETFFDGNPFLLWLRDDATPPDDWQPPEASPSTPTRSASVAASVSDSGSGSDGYIVSPDLLNLPAPRIHRVDATALGELDSRYMDLLPRIVHDLDSQAHFISYAPPSFIAFRHAAYLQLAMTATIPSPGTSQYRLAAIAFDRRVAHLVRPVMQNFQHNPGAVEDVGFDGIDFSLTVHTSTAETEGSLAVEYFIPLRSLRCYVNFDCTGQQMLNSGVVLINGDPVSLDLQKAEEINSLAKNQ
jgi:hypothetical protein